MTRSRRSDDGALRWLGAAGGAAVVRWGWRLFRREFRQQLLVIVLITVVVAAAVSLSTAAYVIAPAGGDAEFGSAEHRYTIDDAEPAVVTATVAAAEERFDRIEVIPRQEVQVLGRSDPLELRAQDPDGPLSGPMLALRDGRHPATSTEVAVAETLAAELGLTVGGSLQIVDGPSASVVGLVENPNRLDDGFVLVTEEANAGADSVTILVEDRRDGAQAFRGTGGVTPVYSWRSGGEGLVAATSLLAVVELSLILVSLVAAAGFVAVSQRRQRQLGMLAAIGSPPSHLRLVTLTNGVLVGAVSAVLGGTFGLVAWVVGAPMLEQSVGIRVDPVAIPWWLVGTILALTIATTTAASWWPARMVARVPITEALSGRRPRPPLTGRSLAPAVVVLAGGTVAVAMAGNVFSPTADGPAPFNSLLVASGTVGIIAGVLMLSPLAVAALASVPPRSPLAVRLAFRDLARYQSRSAAALAAVSLALGMPLALIIGISAVQSRADEGNLSNQQLLITADDLTAPFVTDRAPGRQRALDDEVGRLADEWQARSVVELRKVVDPAREINEFGRPTIRVFRLDEEADGAPVFFADPELLDLLAIAPADPGIELITSETEGFAYRGGTDPVTGDRVATDVAEMRRIAPVFSSLPTAMMTAEGLERRGWEARPAGWLIHTGEPLTDGQIAEARDRAIAAGLTIESRDNQRGLLRLRTAATVFAVIVALAILAMTVGIVRSESGRDLRTLTATGATSHVRRGLTASTAGGLALLGVVLGAVGAYLGLVAGFVDDLSVLTPLPLAHLVAVVVGVPMVAAVAGWLVSGREPTAISRTGEV